MDVFKSLRIVDIKDSPTIGESCQPWIMDFAASIFGAYNPDTGKRMIREFMLLVRKRTQRARLLPPL